MVKGVLELLPDINIDITGLKGVFAEKININWKTTEQNLDADKLQTTLENQNQPIIRSRSKEIESKSGAGTSVDFLELDLVNSGGGVAQDLYVRPSLIARYDPSSNDLSHVDIEKACFLDGEGGGFEFAPKYEQLTRVDGDFIENDSIQGGVLSPNEGRVTFSGQIEFQKVFYQDGGSTCERVTIREATERLYNIGIRHITLIVHVIYTDINGNMHAEQVMGKLGELTGSVTLEDIQEFKFSTKSLSNDKILEKVDTTHKYPM